MPAVTPGRFNILQQSPHDLKPLAASQPAAAGMTKWVPSHYNIRAVTGDGRLVLWNTYRGTMSVFEPEQRATIEAMLKRRGFEAESEGIVKYLFDRGFLVKEGTDEYRRFQLGFGQQHYRTDTLQLILLASEDCNFRCQYCYEEFARGTMQPAVRTGIKKLVQRRLEGLRNLSVSWFGGEPLYGLQAIEDLAPFFLETANAHSIRYSGSMTTNGYLLTPEVADKLLAWKIHLFQITLDGPPADHDRSRPTRDGQGTFAQIFDNLKSLSRRSDDYVVDVRVNFDRKNYPHLEELLDLLQNEFKADSRFRLRFRAVGQWGGPNDDQLEVCGTEESNDIYMQMRMEARKRGLSVSEDLRQVQGMGSQACYAARPYNFIVGATGKLMKCTVELDMNDRNVVGHLTENGDLVLDQDKLALWTEPAFENDSKCHKCVILPACQGVYCPLIRIESGRSPCSSLRLGGKKELRATAESCGSGVRQIVVEAGAGNAPQ